MKHARSVEPREPARSRARPDGPDAPPLRIENLDVRARGGRSLLRVPSLELEAGRALGIRGPSGAGKSTLLFALAGLSDGVSGRVLWGESDLVAMSPTARAMFRARNIGLVFQDFLLFEELGAHANAAIAALYRPRAERRAIQDRARTLLAQFGLADDLDRPVPSRSGGERQRIAVVRALATDPRIVLADEPTANLDREAGQALVRNLIDGVRSEGRTLIVASHDDRLLDAMDRVVTIRDGAPEPPDA